jgi:hypothetical protein
MDPTVLLFIVCILSVLIGNMNIWITDDVRLSVNDLYRAGLITGCIFFFLGLFTLHPGKVIIGLILAGVSFYFLKEQLFVNEMQYMRSMIPQLSTAVQMSKAVEKKPNSISHLLDQIIQEKQKEIIIMKNYLGE